MKRGRIESEKENAVSSESVEPDEAADDEFAFGAALSDSPRFFAFSASIRWMTSHMGFVPGPLGFKESLCFCSLKIKTEIT